MREDLARSGAPTGGPGAAEAIEDEVWARAPAAGKTNLSRAVSELVGAGLLCRHYQGYAVDHHNRGGQRHAVYTLAGPARCLIGAPAAPAQRAPAEQLALL